jgi:hypothetical protein
LNLAAELVDFAPQQRPGVLRVFGVTQFTLDVRQRALQPFQQALLYTELATQLVVGLFVQP